jgi:hypothetical protein
MPRLPKKLSGLNSFSSVRGCSPFESGYLSHSAAPRRRLIGRQACLLEKHDVAYVGTAAGRGRSTRSGTWPPEQLAARPQCADLMLCSCSAPWSVEAALPRTRPPVMNGASPHGIGAADRESRDRFLLWEAVRARRHGPRTARGPRAAGGSCSFDPSVVAVMPDGIAGARMPDCPHHEGAQFRHGQAQCRWGRALLYLSADQRSASPNTRSDVSRFAPRTGLAAPKPRGRGWFADPGGSRLLGGLSP